MDKYLQYDHIELSEDISFIRWAKGSESRDENNWDDWILQHPNQKETVDKAKSIVQGMKFMTDSPSKAVEEKVWSGISKEINTETSIAPKVKSKMPRIIRLATLGAAAAVLLFFFFQNIGNSYDTTVNVPYAKVENITLPDGSEVTINADSELKYDAASWDQNRMVSLNGEAFFSVEKGSNFTVKTKNGSVQVLGTKFNVYDRKQHFKVHCETGKVSVKSKGAETILIRDQAVAVVNKEHIFQKNVPVGDRRSTWQRGIFVYKDVQLYEVVEELERQFDINILIDKSLTEQSYTGSFSKLNRQNALTEVFYPLKLNFEIDGKTVQVSK